jgi:hypothetical protein
MIRIAITQAAYDVIAATLPLGSIGYEAQRSDTGEVFIWLERRAMDRLVRCASRARGTAKSSLRMAEIEASRPGPGPGERR